MTILNVLVASSAIALGVLLNGAAPVNALVAQGHGGLNARSPNHNGILKRQRTTHKNRKRCVAQQAVNPSGSSGASNPQPTDNSGNNNNNSGNNNNNNNNNNTPSVPVQNNPAQVCSGGKVGLAWGPTMPANYIQNAASPKVCWYYNWSAWAADSSVTGGAKFVPMLWGADKESEFRAQVMDSGANYGIALAMNEVNEEHQANMDVGTALGLWNSLLVPLKSRGWTVISPSTTSAPSGLEWMKQWMNQVQTKPDAVALHWYGMNVEDFKSYVRSFIAAFPGYPLWITEFACTDFNGGWCDVPAFAREAIAFLDSTPEVQAYFPFAFEDSMSNVAQENRLMWANGPNGGQGVLTDVGRMYLGL